MTRHVTVDREKEISLFDNMLKGNLEERILLVEAKSGWGKSVLLREFARRCPRNILLADLDFKGGGTTFAEIFSRSCDKLGGLKRFPNLSRQLQSTAHPSINMSSNIILGKNQIDIYLGDNDENQQQARLTTLTDAFFADLRSFRKMLMIMDSFEKADENIKKWLSNAFLSRAHYSANLYLVIAGQQVPEQTLEWECEHVSLEGIAHEHWYRYARSIGVMVPADFIKGCCSICNGQPMMMKSHIDTLAIQRRTI
jgi:hypothetical protein